MIKLNADPKYQAYPKAIAMMNAIRAEASTEYKERVPEATADNIKAVGNPILTYAPTFNEFASALVNRIAFTVISSKMYNNPLKMFKRGLLEVGETIEEIFVALIKAEPYYLENDLGMTDAEDLLKRRLPEITAVFHRRNRQDKYPVTVSYDDLRTAFVSWDGVDNLVKRIIEQLYSSDQYDEFLLMKNIFFEAGTRGALAEVQIPEITDKASTEEAVISMRTAMQNVGFMSPSYNYMHVPTYSNLEDLCLFILPDFNSRMDVQVLAAAFNIDKAAFLSRVIVVDDFGGLENAGVKAILADKDWFMVFDNLLTTRQADNAARLYINWFLHHWQTLSYSPFKTAVAFTVTPSEVLTVTINPSSLTLTRNNNANPTATLLTATVTGTGMYNPDVVWSTTIGTITQDGLLEVPNTWEGTTGTVTAISKQDPTIQDTMTVTLTPASSVTAITLPNDEDENGITLERSATDSPAYYQFTPTVEGNAVQNKGVSYTTTIGKINQKGLLEVPNTVNAQSGVVTIISKQNPDVKVTVPVTLEGEKTATATINVTQ